MKLLFTLFSLLLCSSSLLAHFTHFPERSGQILIKSQSNDLSVGIWNGNVNSEKNLRETTFVDYLSYSLGLPLTEMRDSSLSKSDIFETRKANVLFVLDSAVQASQVSSSWALSSQLQFVTVEKEFYPQDSVSTVTSIITGHSPSEHGIVAKSWKAPKGGVRVAFKADALPQVQNLVDVVTHAFKGNSFTLSASSDFQMASALAANQEVHSANNHGLFWNGKCFESIYPDAQSTFSLCKEDILNQLSQASIFASSFDRESMKIVVDSVQFKLNSKVDLAFFAEVQFALTLSQKIQTQAISDSVPDLYFFTFSSLKEIERVYGVNSPQHQVALSIVDKVISSVLNQFSALYNNKVSGQVLFLQTQTPSNDLKRSVFSIVRSQVEDKSSFDEFYPMIFLNDPLQTNSVCETLSSKLPETEIYCASVFYDFPLRNSQEFVGNQTNPTDNSVASFQIVLWISITLVVTLFAIVYGIFTMDVGGDSLVFRLTNLNTKKTI